MTLLMDLVLYEKYLSTNILLIYFREKTQIVMIIISFGIVILLLEDKKIIN